MRKLLCAVFAVLLMLTLVGCGGYTEEDLRDAYNEGYDDGTDEAETRYEEGYDAGYEEAKLLYYEPVILPDNYADGYEDGFIEGYWEGVQDTLDGAH